MSCCWCWWRFCWWLVREREDPGRRLASSKKRRWSLRRHISTNRGHRWRRQEQKKIFKALGFAHDRCVENAMNRCVDDRLINFVRSTDGHLRCFVFAPGSPMMAMWSQCPVRRRPCSWWCAWWWCMYAIIYRSHEKVLEIITLCGRRFGGVIHSFILCSYA